MVSEAEKGRFSEICREMIGRIHNRSGIGTYKEKILHLVLKKFFCGDEVLHEVKQGSFVADAATETEIFEIQTGGLYPLKKKIPAYLADTDKKITLVFPLISQKKLFWVDRESGEMTEPKKVTVPKAKNFLLREFMWIGSLIDFSRVEIKIVYINADEYRLLDGYGADKKIKATKIDKIPKELIDIVTLSSKADFAALFLPQSLPREFRASEFEKATGLRKDVRGLRALEQLGVIEREKRSGRKVVYRII